MAGIWMSSLLQTHGHAVPPFDLVNSADDCVGNKKSCVVLGMASFDNEPEEARPNHATCLETPMNNEAVSETNC